MAVRATRQGAERAGVRDITSRAVEPRHDQFDITARNDFGKHGEGLQGVDKLGDECVALMAERAERRRGRLDRLRCRDCDVDGHRQVVSALDTADAEIARAQDQLAVSSYNVADVLPGAVGEDYAPPCAQNPSVGAPSIWAAQVVCGMKLLEPYLRGGAPRFLQSHQK